MGLLGKLAGAGAGIAKRMAGKGVSIARGGTGKVMSMAGRATPGKMGGSVVGGLAQRMAGGRGKKKVPPRAPAR